MLLPVMLLRLRIECCYSLCYNQTEGHAHAVHTLLHQRVNSRHAVKPLTYSLSVSHTVTLENLTELVWH